MNLTGRWPSMLLRQVGHELTALVRTPITVILSVGFPLVFFVLLSSLVGNETLDDRGGIRLAQFFAPGMASFGVVMATFSFLAVGFAEARARGVLKRQDGTPLPGWVLIGGRVGAATLLGMAATTLVLGVGAAAYGVQLFARSAAAVVVALVVGSLVFAALGLALGALLPSPQATVAVANGLVIPLSFVSDVFMAGTMPDWMARLGWFFPLKHLAALLGDALNPYLTGSGFQADHFGALVAWGLAGVGLTVWALNRRPAVRRAARAGRAPATDRVARTRQAGPVAVLVSQVRHAQQALVRDATSVFFAVVFPALLVAVIPAVNGGGEQTMADGRTLGSLFAATMATYGAAVTAYLNMPVDLVESRDLGVLKRLRGTPLPVWAMLAGRVIGTFVVALVAVVAVYLLAGLLYRVGLPPAWPLAVAVLALGVVCLALLGLAVTSLATTAQAAIGLALGTLLPLAFISEIFVLGVTLPPALDLIAGVFPLRAFVRAMVSATAEAGRVDLANVAILVAWTVVGAAVVAVRFGWEPRTARARRAVGAGAS